MGKNTSSQSNLDKRMWGESGKIVMMFDHIIEAAASRLISCKDSMVLDDNDTTLLIPKSVIDNRLDRSASKISCQTAEHAEALKNLILKELKNYQTSEKYKARERECRKTSRAVTDLNLNN